MSVIGKLFERILNKRLTSWNTDQLLSNISKTQAGFQADLSTMDLIYALSETVKLRRAQGLPTYACFIDCRKAFPSVFKAGLLVKLHSMGITGRYWRMLTSMYSKIETRILSGHENDMSAEELENLYYQIDTGVREGSIMSPLLYVLFIDGLLQKLKERNLGVKIRHRHTRAPTWVGALMYADDLVLLADSPGELQLMMDVITDYAKKWRFQINESKTKVMAMCERHATSQQRKHNWGDTWNCGGKIIRMTEYYVYLGVTIKSDMDFTTHITQLYHKLKLQQREAAVIGVGGAGVPFDRANRLWQAYVEPKFSYACGVWMQESNDKAHVAVNNVQRNGARLLLGISTMDEANTDPPPCAALLEANLKPAHVLRIMGLLRFWRIVLSRDKSSTLHKVWAVIESHAATTDEHSLNGEVHRLQQKYSDQIGDTVPDPKHKLEWKKLVDNIAKQEMRSWQQQHVRAAGRAAAYAAIRHEAPGETPEYLSHPALSKHERRNIACMRTQCASYVAAHAQHRNTAMFGPPVTYARRHCQCDPCKRTDTTDSTAHVMLHCAAHATDRSEMINSVNRSLSIAATKNRGRHARSLDALGTDTLKLQLLLGSTHLSHLRNGSAEYGQILTASAKFIKAVHRTRWLLRQQ